MRKHDVIHKTGSIHNILHCRQRRIKSRPQVTFTHNFMTFDHVGFHIQWTDIHAYRHAHRNTSHPSLGANRLKFWKRKLKIQATYALQFVCKHTLANICHVFEVWDLESFQMAGVTFKVVQGHLLTVFDTISHIWFIITLHCDTLHRSSTCYVSYV